MSASNAKLSKILALLVVRTCCHILLNAADNRSLERDFLKSALPLLKEHCLTCHSTEKQKGELDLERFKNFTDFQRDTKVWENVVDQIQLGEMPPKDKTPLPQSEKAKLLRWIDAALSATAALRAGDPGPVVLRRLNNAEYKYTIRDLTSVETLNPTREFPADSAAGEGFMNVGQSLVMSPSLATKYMDAAKSVAAHAMLLPNGIEFSSSTSQRDWSEQKLAAIRAFYERFSVNGGGSAVNLQGIKFDTKDGGVIPLARYLTVLIRDKQAIKSGKQSISKEAREAGVNPKYLSLLWGALNDTQPSLILDQVRERWRSASIKDVAALQDFIISWQSSLWRFTQVGHIGKRDGPPAWQVPVNPLAETREVRAKLAAPQQGNESVFYLAASDAADGSDNDDVVWANPRITAPGRSDILLRDLQAVVSIVQRFQSSTLNSAVVALEAATQGLAESGTTPPNTAALAKRFNIDPIILGAWFECLGISSTEQRIEGHMTAKMESAQGYAFIQGWTGPDALSVTANSSDQHVRVPGNMKPRSIAVHPSPKQRVIISWKSPVTSKIQVNGTVNHAHPECGNGTSWSLEIRRNPTRQLLATGNTQGPKEIQIGPFTDQFVRSGDVVSFVVAPRDGNHSCDLTAVDLTLTDGQNTWNLAKDVSPNILAGNPHADSLGNHGVWHFHSEPDKTGADPILPSGSLLTRWQAETEPNQRRELSHQIQALLNKNPNEVPTNSPDGQLYRQLRSLHGPLLSPLLRQPASTLAATNISASATRYGLDPTLFGRHPNRTARVASSDLCVKAPSLLEVRLPAEFAQGSEFVATTTLHSETGREGSVQMQVFHSKPASFSLSAGQSKIIGSKSTWSDGEKPVASDAPILTMAGSASRRRIESSLDDFRNLFPAAICYTKIVPVDEVVTLTLYHREDNHLKRLMLDDSQAKELDRLWDDLHYVSHDALKLVDAYEQLWQYATQDADPSAFTPMGPGIKKKAEDFLKTLRVTEPNHLDAVIKFAERAYRRTLKSEEEMGLRQLYSKLRKEELSHETSIRLVLARIMVAPAFLYKAERLAPGNQPGPVTNWELATRLSYFLWSSAPDESLIESARNGELSKPTVLISQAKRMMKDARIRRFAHEFATTWLHLYDFDQLSEKSESHFPSFMNLRESMHEETIRFFTDLFQNDGSVLNIIDSDYTFLNSSLAQHYGITNVVFRDLQEWRRVEGVKNYGRGGVLAHASALAKHAGASRTSPILRGNWLCEVLLGEKLPKPPKDVPQLPEDEATETLLVRELTEKHSADPKCASCHKRIDPYGYALEAYDPIGRWRDRDLGGRNINTTTRVMDGSEIRGFNGLKRYLTTKRKDAFLKQFCKKLLGYSLGRSVILSDSELIQEMQQQLKRSDYRVSAAIETILRSRQFREIRGKEMALEEGSE